MEKARAVFVDRDGVLNELVPDPSSGVAESPLSPESVRLFPHASDSLETLKRAGFLLVCVTNQPAAAKGAVSVAQVLSVQARLSELLGQRGVRFDAVRLCLHHPDGTIGDLGVICDCRKPKPGMLLSAADELGVDMATSWMIGDTDADIEAGRAAGCRTILIETPGSRHKRAGAAAADAVTPDLPGAVRIIVATREND